MKTLDQTVSNNRAFVVPEKILVATDLADTEYLIPHAVAQARACGSSLTLVHVIPPGQAIPLDASAIPYLDVAEMKHEAEQTLKRVAAQAAGQRHPLRHHGDRWQSSRTDRSPGRGISEPDGLLPEPTGAVI